MTTYLIHEANLERLEKKMATIQKKCAQSHCSFKYEIIGEKFHDCKAEDGTEYIAKYYEVEVEGTAQYNGWRFVATLDHHDEGNVIRAFDTELAIPDKYKTCGPTCEHCNKIRSRKDTYLVYNEETQEFKQVGKSCLKEFTNGLSAEDAAFFVSIYDGFEAAGGYSGSNFTRYIDVKAITRYAFECYKHWGYQKSRNSFYEEVVPVGYRSTLDRVSDYYYINRAMGRRREELRNEMDAVGFNPESEYAVSYAEKALEWIRNEKDANNEYIRNLHIICSDDYTEWRSLGILVSLTTAYLRHIDQIAAYEKKQKDLAETKISSKHVGEIGARIDVKCSSFECKSSWEGQFGMTYLYTFKDEAGNVFIWYASNPVNDEDRVIAVKGTVKDHSEYNGIKQTVLTRCKVTLAEKKEEQHEPYNNENEKAIEDFLNYCNA